MGRILLIEFDDADYSPFDEIVAVLKKHHSFKHLKLNGESVLSISGLELYPDRRKAYCNHIELNLTAKEYDLLYLFISNMGRVLTYGQIYQQVWGEDSFGNEKNILACHVYNLRKKIDAASPGESIVLRCIREIGYCFESKQDQTNSTQ